MSDENEEKKPIEENNVFNGKKIVFSGIRDKELESFIKQNGGKVLNNISKETFMLIVKDEDNITTKVEDSKKKGIPIITLNDFNQKYR